MQKLFYRKNLKNQSDQSKGHQHFISEAFAIAIPSMVGFIFFYGYQVADMYWVSKLERGAPTAVALAGILYLTLMSINEIIGISSIALFSQSYGYGDKPRTGYLILQAIMIKTVIGILLAGVFLLIVNRFCFLYTSDPAVIKYLKDYGNLISLAIIVTMPYASVLTALRTIGEANKALLVVVISFFFNLIMDPLFIFGIGPFPKLGVKGSALVGVLTQVIGLILSLYVIRRNKAGIKIFSMKKINFNFQLYKKFIFIGIPAGGVILLSNLENSFVASLAAKYGSATSDGFGIGTRIAGFFLMANLGLSMGASVMTGQFIVLNKTTEIRRHMIRYLFLIMLILSLFAFPLFIFSEELLWLFTSQAEIVYSGKIYLKFLSIIIVLQCANFSLAAVFEGAGKNLPVFLANSAVVLCFEVPLLSVLYFLLKLDIAFIWGGVLAAHFIYLSILFFLFNTKLWENKVIDIGLSEPKRN